MSSLTKVMFTSGKIIKLRTVSTTISVQGNQCSYAFRIDIDFFY